MLTSPGYEPAYKKLAAYNSIVLDKTNQTCLDYSYINMVKELRDMSWSSEGGLHWVVFNLKLKLLIVCPFYVFFVLLQLNCRNNYVQ